LPKAAFSIRREFNLNPVKYHTVCTGSVDRNLVRINFSERGAKKEKKRKREGKRNPATWTYSRLPNADIR
jgi:hypothetical protein